jgi:hypothetical protein
LDEKLEPVSVAQRPTSSSGSTEVTPVDISPHSEPVEARTLSDRSAEPEEFGGRYVEREDLDEKLEPVSVARRPTSSGSTEVTPVDISPHSDIVEARPLSDASVEPEDAGGRYVQKDDLDEKVEPVSFAARPPSHESVEAPAPPDLTGVVVEEVPEPTAEPEDLDHSGEPITEPALPETVVEDIPEPAAEEEAESAEAVETRSLPDHSDEPEDIGGHYVQKEDLDRKAEPVAVAERPTTSESTEVTEPALPETVVEDISEPAAEEEAESTEAVETRSLPDHSDEPEDIGGHYIQREDLDRKAVAQTVKGALRVQEKPNLWKTTPDDEPQRKNPFEEGSGTIDSSPSFSQTDDIERRRGGWGEMEIKFKPPLVPLMQVGDGTPLMNPFEKADTAEWEAQLAAAKQIDSVDDFGEDNPFE